MKETARTRIATAEIHWGRNRSEILWVGNRSVHQFWALLAPYFRDVLLAPQRRTDDEIVAWTWRESTERRMPTGADLAAVRKRLAGNQRAFADQARDETPASTGSTNLAQIATATEQMITRLVGLTDAELAAFVACTESGLRLHSWGAMRAADVVFPESRRREAAAASGESSGSSSVDAMETAPPRRRRSALAVVGILFLVGGTTWGVWRWRATVSEAPREKMTASEAKAAMPFTPGRPAARFGEADGRSSGKPRANVEVTPAAKDEAEPRSAANLSQRVGVTTAETTVNGGGVLEEFESKSALAKPFLTPPTAVSPGGPNAGVPNPGPVAGAGGPGRTGAMVAGVTTADRDVPDERGSPGAVAGVASKSSREEAAFAFVEARSLEAQHRVLVADRRQPRTAKEQDDRPGPEPRGRESGANAAQLAVGSEAGLENSVHPGPEWESTVRVSATPWSVRLLVDAIVPTEPVRAGAVSTLAATRERAMAEWRERLPAAFARVHGRRGFVVEFPNQTLSWRLPFGLAGVATSAGGGRAEISWDESRPPPCGIFELSDNDGHSLAILEAEVGGAVVVRVARGGRARFWVMVEGSTEKFVWRGAGAGQGGRCDVALTAAAGTTTNGTLTLFDPATGWAITRRLTQGRLVAP